MKMQTLFIIPAIFSVFLLSSCASTIQQPDPPLNLTLTRPISVSSHTAMIMIQNGRIKSEMSIDQYAPYCRLEMKGPKNYTRIIKPDTFTVTGISRETNYVMNDSVKVASLGFILGSGITDEIYSTTFYLKSATQGDVELITCEWWEDAGVIGSRYLTMKEIEDTLHPLFNF